MGISTCHNVTKNLSIVAEHEQDLVSLVHLVNQIQELHDIPWLPAPVTISCIGEGIPGFLDGDLYLPAHCPIDIAIHEIGHMLDWALIEDDRARSLEGGEDLDSVYLSETSSDMIQGWQTAINNTRTVQHAHRLAHIQNQVNHDEVQWEYFNSAPELFARSYTQWVLTYLGHHKEIRTYSRQIEDEAGYIDLAHWPAAEFAAIDLALTDLLSDPYLFHEKKEGHV